MNDKTAFHCLHIFSLYLVISVVFFGSLSWDYSGDSLIFFNTQTHTQDSGKRTVHIRLQQKPYYKNVHYCSYKVVGLTLYCVVSILARCIEADAGGWIRYYSGLLL